MVTAKLYVEGAGTVAFAQVFSDGPREARVEFKPTASRHTWYSLEVEDVAGLKAYSNPIWIAADSRHANPWAADLYNRARARGHDHPHAVRILGRAWADIIWRCWQDGLPYDPARGGWAPRPPDRARADGPPTAQRPAVDHGPA